MELTDKHILERLQKGDEQVFEEFFKTYYERLCNYANTILNDMDEAEEMVQGALMESKRIINSQKKSFLHLLKIDSLSNVQIINVL